MKQTHHVLERSGAKGVPFVGRCVLCGKTELKISDAFEICSNPNNVTHEQAVLKAIKGD